MKKLILLSIVILSSLFSTNFDDSFITKFEYGKMLYENPRGISCVECHGKNAKGRIISSFTHYSTKNDKKYECIVKSKDITNISLSRFKAILDPNIEKPKKKIDPNNKCEKLIYENIMPTYFLTQEELNSIHYYLTNKE